MAGRFEVSLVSEASLHQRALAIAQGFDLPATYDAHYLALAENLGTELWTADEKLIKAVGTALPWVRSLARYAG